MLKSYKDFINEQYNGDDDEIFEEIQQYLGNNKAGNTSYSFSYYAKNPGSIVDESEIKEYIKDLINLFGKNNMEKYVKKIIDDGEEASYGDENGHKDIIFHNFNKDFPLGGGIIVKGQDNFIKYAYGYHTSKYGKLAIEQVFNNLTEFKKDAILNAGDDYVDNVYSELISSKSLIFIPKKENGSYFDDHNITYDKIIDRIAHKGSINAKGEISEDINDGVIVEFYLDDEKISTLDDWIELMKKIVYKYPKIANSFNWEKHLNRFNDKESNRNLIKSIITLNKFKL